MLPIHLLAKINRRLLMVLSVGLILLGGVFLQAVVPFASDGLQWEHRDENFWNFHTHDRRFWHKDAKKYCQQLTDGGHYDWRLPTLDEMKSLLQLTVRHRRGLAGVERAIYWTATPYDEEGHRFWAVSFLSEQYSPMEEHNYNSVVCVRGGTR